MLQTISNRLSALASTIMGEASSPKEKCILCILPTSEPTESFAKIQKKHPNVKIIFKSNKSVPGVDPEYPWGEATILVGQTLPPDPKLAPNLELVHFLSAGTDWASKSPIYRDTDVTLTTSSGIHGPQIAQWVIMEMLSHSHKEKILVQWQKEHKWGPSSELGEMRDFAGQRLGVLGYGSIGRQTAKICKAMGMDVIAYTASPRTSPESKKDTSYIVPGTGDVDGRLPSAWYSGLDKASLHEFLRQDIDVLVVSVPLTDATRHFLGKEEFEILGRKNAFIANISRGAILHQDELIAALKKKAEEGGLRGAALDVTDPEPLNAESELWDMENVAITPHVSGLGKVSVERSLEILEMNLTNLEAGKPLINVVDRKRGY